MLLVFMGFNLWLFNRICTSIVDENANLYLSKSSVQGGYWSVLAETFFHGFLRSRLLTEDQWDCPSSTHPQKATGSEVFLAVIPKTADSGFLVVTLYQTMTILLPSGNLIRQWNTLRPSKKSNHAQKMAGSNHCQLRFPHDPASPNRPFGRVQS